MKPTVAKEFEAATPKGARLPERAGELSPRQKARRKALRRKAGL